MYNVYYLVAASGQNGSLLRDAAVRSVVEIGYLAEEVLTAAENIKENSKTFF